MIKNGNYIGTDAFYKKLLPYIKRAFCEYYTDNKNDELLVQDVVEDKIDRTYFNTFIDREFVETYYDKFICKYRDEILDRFYSNLDVPRDKKFDDVIWQKKALLSEANINIAMLGGMDFRNSKYTEDTIAKIEESREKIVNYCGVKRNNDPIKRNNMDYNFIRKLHHKFLSSIREIEEEHSCDVFNDIERIEQNNKKELMLYLKSINENVDNILDDDIKTLNSKSFDMAQVENLSSNGIFFDMDLHKGGLIDAFTSDACDILKDRYADLSEKIDIMCDRLTFLLYLNVKVEFKYFTRDEIFNIKKLLAKCETRAECKDLIKKIKKEYEYQCSYCNMNVLGEDLKDMSPEDQTDFQDRWFEGQFFDKNMADKIEEKRTHYSSLTKNGLQYLPEDNGQGQILKDMLENKSLGINASLHEDNNIWKPINVVYVLAKYIGNREDFLSILVHELNHSMAVGKPYYIDDYVLKETSGISHEVYAIDGNTLDDTLARSETDQLEEYINERQSKEILGKLLDILDEEKVKWPVDKVLDKDTFECGTYYDFYDFIFNDFYELFKEELKRLNVDGSMKFNFDFLMPMSREEELLRTNPKRFIDRNFKKDSYYKNGYVDMNNLASLNRLAETFSCDIYPSLSGRSLKTGDLTKRENIDSLPVGVQMKVYNLIKRKNEIMAKIRDDYARKLQLNQKSLEKNKKLKKKIVLEEDLDDINENFNKSDNSLVNNNFNNARKLDESTFEEIKRWIEEDKSKDNQEDQEIVK